MLSNSKKEYDPVLFRIWVAMLFGSVFVLLGLLLASQYVGMSSTAAALSGIAIFSVIAGGYFPLFWGKTPARRLTYVMVPPNIDGSWLVEVPCLGWLTNYGDGIHFIKGNGELICAGDVLKEVQAWFDGDPHPEAERVYVEYGRW